jgi:Uma2 family endonuclease
MRTMQSSDIRYVRPLRPVVFRDTDPGWEVSENKKHQMLCELLRALLRVATGNGSAAIGSDQFVYFDPSNPRRKCAPDAFVKLGVADSLFPVWKTWEGGVPELCVEILSPSDYKEKLTLEEKLRRFHAIGVREVICFNIEAELGQRLRAWDLVCGDLIERVVTNESTPCLTLGQWFVLAPAPEHELDVALRLSADPEGTKLLPSPLESARAGEREARAAAQEAQEELARLRALLAEKA